MSYLCNSNIDLVCSTWTCVLKAPHLIHLPHLPLLNSLKYRAISFVGAASKLKLKLIRTWSITNQLCPLLTLPAITSYHWHHPSNSNLHLDITLTLKVHTRVGGVVIHCPNAYTTVAKEAKWTFRASGIGHCSLAHIWVGTCQCLM